MDDNRFDEIARMFALPRSRRLVLQRLAGGIGGGIVGLLGGMANASPRCKRVGQHCQTSEDCCPGPFRNGDVYCAGTKQTTCQACPTGTIACDGGCVDVRNDPNNCGACGTICPSGGICDGGACCVPEEASTTCADKDCGAAINNCGQSVTCGPDTCGGTGQTCGGGGVPNVCGCTDDGTVCQSRDCGDVVNNCGQTVSCGSCTGIGESCGGAGVPGVCGCTPEATGTTCAGKDCGAAINNCGQSVDCGSCGGGTTCCGNHCADLSSDNANCGDCGVICPASEFLTCQSGSCECQAGVPVFCPNIGCVNLTNDFNNCGGCGTACNAEEICCSGTCANILTDPNHCGSCDLACFTGDNCVAGKCQ